MAESPQKPEVTPGKGISQVETNAEEIITTTQVGDGPKDQTNGVPLNLEKLDSPTKDLDTFGQTVSGTLHLGDQIKMPPHGRSFTENSNLRQKTNIGFLLPPKVPGDLGSLSGFRIIKILGAGGMGLVFLAEDESLKRQLAIKVILPTHANQTTKERFFREARATAALHHDNVIPIFQVGEDNGVPFLAMPFLQGQPLDKYMSEKKKLSVEEVLRITKQGLAGLSSAHSRNMVHRDIKPSNIWLEGSRKKVILLDFGLAKGGSSEDVSLTRVGAIMGTPAYMSPEQAQGKEVDRRSDLFSMGVVLYEMLTGEGPFKGKTVMAVLANLLTKEPKPPCELDPGIPQEVSDICLWMLEKDVEKRPKSAREVVTRIQAFEKGPKKSHEVFEPSGAPNAAKTIQGNPVKTQQVTPVITQEGQWKPTNIEEFGRLYPETESTRPGTSGEVTRKKRREKNSLVPVFMGLGGVLFFVVGLVFFLGHNEPISIEPPKKQNPIKLAENKGNSISEQLKKDPEPAIERGKETTEPKGNNGEPSKKDLQKSGNEKTGLPPDEVPLEKEIKQILPTKEQKEEEERYLKVIANQEALIKTNPTNSEYQYAVAAAYGRLAYLYWGLKRLKEAEESYLKAIAIYETLVMANPMNLDYRYYLAADHYHMGDMHRLLNRKKEAMENYQKALAIYENLAKADPTDPEYQRNLASSHYSLGDLYQRSNRQKEAMESYQKALAIYENLVKADPTNSEYKNDLAYTKRILEELRNP